MSAKPQGKSSAELHVVAIAILYRSGQFLMQLRDDNPQILYPGHWAFFGGHLDPGETAEQGIVRELQEEIGYDCPDLRFFQQMSEPLRGGREGWVERNVFFGPLVVETDRLSLNEGMDLKLVSPEEIRKGWARSPKLDEVRPLGAPHRELLLAFMESEAWTIAIGPNLL
jgi:8-oxo-dGTP diphosphatase